ncbi:MAG: ABC transporter permease, partial [Bacteroidota bacterium]
TNTRIDGIFTTRDTIAKIDESVMAELLDSLPYPAKAELQYRNTTIGYTPDSSKLGLRYQANSFPMLDPPPADRLLHGRLLTSTDQDQRVAVINTPLAKRLISETDSLDAALGQEVLLMGDTLSVVGIFQDGQEESLGFGVTLGTLRLLPDAPTPNATLNIALENVHNVLDAQGYTDGWMKRHFANIPDATESFTHRGRLEQLAQGIMVFRMVMGFIIGVAVVVGGVGVMNVLLMSIAERTPEIGVRKAVGASRGTIIRQFLAESIAISTIGSFFGVILGIVVALIAAPILTYALEEVQFQAVFTLNTVMVVAVVAVLTGIVFGTYPARKAAGLDPVVAIRR